MSKFTVNNDDERLTAVDAEKETKIDEYERDYGDRIDQAEKQFDKLSENAQAWADQQTQLQQEQTDHTIDKIEQQKEKAQKDYIKEQSGAYVDWQKASNQYGVNAEQMAAAGLKNTGYSESSQVSMYNAYQNRVAVARESYQSAILNYDNAIKDAQLQNNSILAEIAYNALQQQLEYGLQSIQYKNSLLSELADKKLQIESLYYNKWKGVLDQINTENSLAEQQRQFNASMAEQKRQYDLSLKEQQRQFDERQKEEEDQIFTDEDVDGDGSSFTGTSSYGSPEYDYTIGQRNKMPGGEFSIRYVKTDYYEGYLPQKTAIDCGYGSFNNGYQPRYITGHGVLKKTGKTVTFNTKTLSGEVRSTTQNIWEAEDGTLWYWEGRDMSYHSTEKAESSNRVPDVGPQRM